MGEVTANRGFDVLAEMAPLPIWDGILARAAHGELVSLAVIELAPGSHVSEHRHENEQLGVLVSGSMHFRIGEETRELAPGAVWTIPANQPHEVSAGPQGAVAVEAFAPRRGDWSAIEPAAPQPPAYP